MSPKLPGHRQLSFRVQGVRTAAVAELANVG
jgi:hypothetical protein